MQCLGAHPQSRGYVSAGKFTVGSEPVVGYCCAGIDHKYRLARVERLRACHSGYAVAPESGRGRVAYAYRQRQH